MIVVFFRLARQHGPPRGVIALDFLFTLVFVSGARFAVRALVERPLARRDPRARGAREVLIVGAGNGGQQVAFELRRNPGCAARRSASWTTTRASRACASPASRCSGHHRELPRMLDGVKPDEVIIAIPSAPGMLRQKVVTACRERAIPVGTLPTTFELLSGGLNLMRQVREVRVEDVLGREPVRVEIDRVGAYLRGRTVLVTGAGGSIGSELEPSDRARGSGADGAAGQLRERALRDPARARGGAPLRTDGGRCWATARTPRGCARCSRSSGRRWSSTRPRTSTCHWSRPTRSRASRNIAVADAHRPSAAVDVRTQRVVLISTDKAVNPARVMGASKALAEWAIEAAQNRWKGTRYSSVRFGNVLGSSGSVVPIFRRQIAQGGPVTVTDEKMTRYFMTIPRRSS